MEIEMKSGTKLTSVKIITDLYKKFRAVALNEEFTLQKLVNRSMDRYLKEEEFKESIISTVLSDFNLSNKSTLIFNPFNFSSAFSSSFLFFVQCGVPLYQFLDVY